VEYGEHHLLDGGISDPIPIQKAEEDGFKKNIVVLTRNRGYYKKPSRFSFFIKRKYPHYPELHKTLMNRYQVYNQTVKELEEREKEGKALVIQPRLKVSRIEKDPNKLDELYEQGYEDTKNKHSEILKWAGIAPAEAIRS
jgi:predicted patatin/cPLA2 family phospholipase